MKTATAGFRQAEGLHSQPPVTCEACICKTIALHRRCLEPLLSWHLECLVCMLRQPVIQRLNPAEAQGSGSTKQPLCIAQPRMSGQPLGQRFRKDVAVWGSLHPQCWTAYVREDLEALRLLLA